MQADSTRLLTTQAQFARLPAIAQRTVAAVGLKNWSASDLLGESSVTSTDNSDFLTFNVSDASPARATALATEYANQYVAYRQDFQTTQLETALQSLRTRIAGLRRAGATNTTLYGTLTDRAGQLAALEAVVASGGNVVRAAGGAGRSASNVVRDGIFALVLGLIAGVGLAFLRDALDQRPRSAAEIGDRLHLRLLGRLPRPPRALSRANRLVMLSAPETPYAEAFRMVRMSLDFVTGRGMNESRQSANRHVRPTTQRCQRVMITSAVEGEGKSTTVGNLAVAFALAGRKVVLVDLDFRRAWLHRFFDLNMQPGIADVVLGSAHLDDVIAPVELEPPATGRPPVGSLHVVPLGSIPPRAADASLHAGVGAGARSPRTKADLMLIDSPPLLRVGDALALTNYVDELLS